MGQYYLGYTRFEDDALPIEFIWENPSGYKLMEHAYYGDNFVNGMCRQIYQKPQRVAWVGDYADDYVDCFANDNLAVFSCDNADKIKYVHKQTWGERVLRSKLPTPFDNLDKYGLSDDIYYLVNHSKKEYIDLRRYLENTEDEFNVEDDCYPHPLPLLTAVGNGMGGGDYHKSIAMNYEMVGYWFYDILSIENKNYDIPDDLTDVTNAADYQFIDFNFSERK